MTYPDNVDPVLFVGDDVRRPAWLPARVLHALEAARGLLRLSHPEGVEVPQGAQHGEPHGARHRRRGRPGDVKQSAVAGRAAAGAAQDGDAAAAAGVQVQHVGGQ